MPTKTKKSPKTAPETEAIETKEVKKGPSGKYFYANGRRKTSVARVRLYKGDGSFLINDKVLDKFCQTKVLEEVIKYPLKITGLAGKFTITVRVSGGGVNAQAEAIRHGISRALIKFDETLRHTIKQQGLLTRDPRVKERKKFGLKRARKGPQFSKR